MKWLIGFFTLFGLNFSFWTVIGLMRFGSDRTIKFIRFIIALFSASDPKQGFFLSFKKSLPVEKKRVIYTNPKYIINSLEVAVIIPAHNEEAVIAETLNSLKKILPMKNIFVGSDNSTDNTVKIVKSFGANVVNIIPNRGKAGVLKYLLEYFNLYKKYKAILIVDADTQISETYLQYALPLFDNPKVVAVAGHATSFWKPHNRPSWRYFFSAYRIRFYRILQAFMRYGQTWHKTNVTTIVPGFCSMYRTSVLPLVDITAEGLVIEDFNMTFEIRHKNLGLIAYSPHAYGVTHDPNNIKDYIKQIKRWNLGFWQTVKKHGFWQSFFWFSTSIYLFEMITFGLFFLSIPLILLWFIFSGFTPIEIPFLANTFIGSEFTVIDLLVGVFLIDYLMSVVVALYEKKPWILFYGLMFIILRYIDTVMFLYTLPLAWFAKSNGKWKSPKRIVE